MNSDHSDSEEDREPGNVGGSGNNIPADRPVQGDPREFQRNLLDMYNNNLLTNVPGNKSRNPVIFNTVIEKIPNIADIKRSRALDLDLYRDIYLGLSNWLLIAMNSKTADIANFATQLDIKLNGEKLLLFTTMSENHFNKLIDMLHVPQVDENAREMHNRESLLGLVTGIKMHFFDEVIKMF